jgi:hypothetical protein
MRDPFAGYDAWLERPYQDMMEEDERFADWAEEEGYDLDNPDDMVLAEQDYDFWLQDCAEAQAEAKYEAYLDRLEMEAAEADDDWGRYNDYD